MSEAPVVCLTGYRGLAERLLVRLTEAGFRVSCLVRSAEAMNPLRERFPTAYFHHGDVADPGSCREWLESSERWGAVGALINNAALPGPGGRLHEVDFEEYRRSIEVNLTAPSFLCHLALRHWEDRRRAGVLINLSGGGATSPRPTFSAYAITKTALVRLTETIAVEYPKHRAYAISPGALMTPMIEAILRMDPKKVHPGDFAEAERRSREGGVDPDKAANLVLWLLQEQPEHLNGRLIHAIWDDYRRAPRYSPEVGWWTLRRIDEPCKKNLERLTGPCP